MYIHLLVIFAQQFKKKLDFAGYRIVCRHTFFFLSTNDYIFQY